MPIAPTYPGVYVEEIPSGVRTITGVATSITAFIGRARRGPVNAARLLTSFGDFERTFGGLWEEYPMSYAVLDFYNNGGRQAVIVRVLHPNLPQEVANEARDAAQDVADAADQAAQAAGATAAAVVAAAKAEADKDANKDEPRHGAAQHVLDAADKAQGPNATAASVSKAAADAVGAVAVARATAKVGDLTLEAASEGDWGNGLLIRVDHDVLADENETQNLFGLKPDQLFNLTLFDRGTGAVERYRNVSLVAGIRQVDRILENDSGLMRVAGDLPANAARPPESDAATKDAAKPVLEAATGAAQAADATPKDVAKAAQDTADKLTDPAQKAAAVAAAAAAKAAAAAGNATPASVLAAVTDAANKAVQDALGKPPFSANPDPRSTAAQGGTDGGPLDANDVTSGDGLEENKSGLFALEKADLFNLLCIPEDVRGGYSSPDDYPATVYPAALGYCVRKRALLIVDPPAGWSSVGSITNQSKGLTDLGLSGLGARNAALYFPRVLEADPRRNGQIDTFVPCGLMAGVMARTDTQRGVWKAPAGLDATLNGIRGLALNLTDDENGILNPLGVNVLRAFPIIGRVAWGARTMRGADLLADEYKYVPVRRTALFIEESLFRGLKWVVFEPNADPLWASIRLNVGAFLHNLFRQGAFAGTTPAKAYFVACDSETTTQNDVDLGIVNVVVGFAPLKPAEFVIIKVQQMAGQIET